MSAYRNSSYNNRNRRPRYKGTSDDWGSILLCYVIPFVILNGIIFFLVTTEPKCTVTVSETNDYVTSQVAVKINSFFPTKSISVSMDGEEIELEKTKGRTYKAPIYKNGALVIKIVNFNGMPHTEFAHVTTLDGNPPEVEETSNEDGILTIKFSDFQSGINCDSIYATDSAGNRQEPLRLDRSTATAVFVMDPDGLEVYVEDMAGNSIKPSFHSRIAGEDEILDDETSDEEDSVQTNAQ